MQRHAKEGGYALIMMLGITAALAIMAATIVAVTANTQGATASNRSQMSAFDYAEAGLDSAAMAIRSTPWPAANQSFSQASLTAAYNATYPSGPPLTVMVYDNQATVNPAITWDQGGPANGSTPDGELWVEAQVTVNGKTARVRELVGQVNLTTKFVVPNAAIYTNGNVAFTSGGGNAFAVNADGSPNTSLPHQISIMAQGSFSGNWSSTLSPNGGAPTLAVQTNGTVYNPAPSPHNQSTSPGTGGVAPLSSVLPQSTIDTMTSQAQAGSPTQADSNGTVATAALITQLQLNQGKTTNVGYDLVVNGDLTLQSGIANFHSLYVTGNLTVQSGGQMNATSLYVGKNFTVSGTGMTQSCGPTYVGGNVSWNSNASVVTTNYLDSSAPAGPLYVVGSFTSAGGPFNDVLGPTYVGGSVTFSGNNAQITCPLFVTPGQISTSGSGDFGTVAQPMVLLGLAGSSSSQAMQLTAQGTFTGLVINMDGGVNLNNSGNSQPPNNYSFFIDGAVMATGDVDFNNNGNVGYDPTALANLQTTATTTSTNVLPGTWQELSPSGAY